MLEPATSHLLLLRNFLVNWRFSPLTISGRATSGSVEWCGVNALALLRPESNELDAVAETVRRASFWLIPTAPQLKVREDLPRDEEDNDEHN